jgi:hypothetical protein
VNSTADRKGPIGSFCYYCYEFLNSRFPLILWQFTMRMLHVKLDEKKL